ncbi:MAG: LLM class flavin-dependent oxidoreductase, partial [Actinomycetota bacterium]
MKLGLSLPTFTADVGRPLRAARRAAADGFDGVFAVDHLFPPGSPERPALEPFTLLAAVAAREPGLTVGVLVTRA